MTIEQRQVSLSTKKLYLSKDRLLRYYFDVILLSVITISILLKIGTGFISKLGHYNSPYLLLFVIFPLLTLSAFINKRQELKLTEVSTALIKKDIYLVVKDTLKTLGWQVKVDRKGFIEAYTNNFGLWTWTDQMVTVFIEDNRVLFTSISNADTYSSQAFSLGQNSRNKRQFVEMFELISTRQSS